MKMLSGLLGLLGILLALYAIFGRFVGGMTIGLGIISISAQSGLVLANTLILISLLLRSKK